MVSPTLRRRRLSRLLFEQCEKAGYTAKAVAAEAKQLTGHFVLLEFPMPDPPIVYLEAVSEELYLEAQEQVRRYTRVFDFVQASALSIDESRELIRSRLSAL
ncbi:Scr1 family TA system antitoxin-like transcriptional regulator [Nocardiopsis sp. LOL_012]|uniref:Scr1 family TA system antitoxin-like transcriptional regulator n=1 Tax=Nocardiopsis sp. LOL_012 TaxID=3345409 RepID=UPI003A85C6F4